MKADGHQIGSHTWSHQRLPTIGKSLLRQQMIYNEIAIADILGVFPTYMRPPYSASNDDVDRWLGELGYHVTYFDLDTEGYLHDCEDTIDISQDIVKRAFTGKDTDTQSYLHIEHDTVYETVETLVPYTIRALYRAGFKPVTVGECLGDPEENWYRSLDEDNEKRAVELGQDPIPAEPSDQAWPVLSPSISTFKKLAIKHRLSIFDKFRFSHVKHHHAVNGSHSAVNESRFPANDSLPFYYLVPTIDGRCGPAFGNATCYNQKYENCCSKSGWCGSTEGHCLIGCQQRFGRCWMST